ncbi:hypothetical protein [Vandammella animalimorsus]|uniref:hypothetical protein n=1 Tax=Vandammella animalimorsus TaxID=2029117 RepID=UPI0011C43A7D|nr:hypothetical protein [Vandammella animalimorsus]
MPCSRPLRFLACSAALAALLGSALYAPVHAQEQPAAPVKPAPLTADEIALVQAQMSESSPYQRYKLLLLAYENAYRAALLDRCAASAALRDGSIVWEPAAYRALQADAATLRERMGPGMQPALYRLQMPGHLWAWRHTPPSERQAMQATWRSPAHQQALEVASTLEMLQSWLDAQSAFGFNVLTGEAFALTPIVLKAQLKASGHEAAARQAIAQAAPELLADWERVGSSPAQHSGQDQAWLAALMGQLHKHAQAIVQDGGLLAAVQASDPGLAIEQGDYAQWLGVATQASALPPADAAQCQALRSMPLSGPRDPQALAAARCALLPAPADTAAAQRMTLRMRPADYAPQTSRWLCARPGQD